MSNFCKTCGARFQTLADLRIHITNTHPPLRTEATKKGYTSYKQSWKSKAHPGYNTPAPTPKIGSASAAASSQSRTETVNEEATASTENKEGKNGEEESKDE